MPTPGRAGKRLFKPHLWLIALVGVMVPRRLRSDWRGEWEAELQHREALLSDWRRLDWRTKLDLTRRSLGAFWDALWMQTYRWEGEMIQDVRFGLRMLLKHRGFTLIAILTLTLGIGASTAVFSAVQAVLLRPLPYPDTERLIQIRYSYPQIAQDQVWVPHRDMIDWQEQGRSFERIGVYQFAMFNFAEEGSLPEAVYGLRVTHDLLPTLGVRPALGRLFSPEEDEPGRNRAIILSDDFWRNRLGARPDVIGTTIRANSESYVVIGVMPPDFNFPLRLTTDLRLTSRQMGFWAPIGADVNRLSRDYVHGLAVARLKPGVTIEQAQSEADAIMARLAQDYPQTNAGRRARLVSLKEQVVGAAHTPLLLLFGSIGLVVLLACANIASLLLVRADARQREMAIRQAVGASRGRLVRQALTESMLLAFGGGIGGCLLAYWSLPLLLRLAPPEVPRLSDARIDLWVFGFTMGVTTLAGLLFGLAPAWRASRINLHDTLKQTSSNAGPLLGATGSALIVAEMAIALVLTVGASLLAGSYVRLMNIDPGFRADQVLAAIIIPSNQQYPAPREQVEFYRRLTERVEALPGVESAGFTNGLPLSGNNYSAQVRIEGRPPVNTNEPDLEVDTPAVSAHYMKTMGMTLLKGRLIDERDTEESLPVAVINEVTAERFWPGEDPLGKRLSVGPPEEDRVWRQVAGIIRPTRHRGLDEPLRPEVFLPIEQAKGRPDFLVVRSGLPVEGLATAVRQAVASVDPIQPVFLINSMGGMLDDSVSERRFSMVLLGLFSLLALMIAAVGTYGVVAYAVAQRTHEVGVRMALGAEPRNVLRLMIGWGMRPALAGIGGGLAAALVLTRLMESLLFEVSATDPLTFAGITLLLSGIASLACYLPARRAAKVDPLLALRHE